MKRFMFGVVWFVVFWRGPSVICGVIVGGSAGAGTSNAQEGYDAGRAAGQEFGRKYGALILLGSLGLSILGTATGILPGTKKRKDA